MTGLPSGRIVSVQVGRPRSLVAANGRKWRSAIVKEPVLGPARLEGENFVGDYQANRKYHGGPDKAVCFFATERMAALGTTVGITLGPGAFGENLTVEGLTEEDVCIGDTLVAGSLRLQVSQPRMPCASIIKRWSLPELPLRMMSTGWTGYYCRALEPGEVEMGDAISVVERPNPDWTIARANGVVYAKPGDVRDIAALRATHLLSAEWRRMLDHFLEEAR